MWFDAGEIEHLRRAADARKDGKNDNEIGKWGWLDALWIPDLLGLLGGL